jgi:hypothetical protein
MFLALSAQIDHVNVGAQPNVVSQVVTHIVGIVVNHDVIVVPEPIVDITKIRVCHRKEETAKAKTVRIATTQAPNMASANRSGKTPMFPRVVKMVTDIVPFMAYPTIVFCVDMRRFRMAFRIAVRVRCWLVRNRTRRWMRRRMNRRRTMGWNMTSTYTVFAAMLRRLRVWLRSVLIAVFLGQSNRAGQEKYAK